VAIRSQPGVRSDLFHRPLEQTLITDFFGGVAHAEVITDSPAEHFPRITDSTVAETDPVEKESRLVHELAEILQTSTDGTGNSVTRLLRAWGSVGIMGLLIARAILRTKQ
jgi:phosphatidylinositol glycan class K